MTSFQFGDFTFNSATGEVIGPDGAKTLRPKTSLMLLYFLNHPTSLVTKEELYSHLWPNSIVSEHTLSQSILDLRQALNDSAREPKFIRTLPKRGFEWLVPVSQTHKQSSEAYIKNDGVFVSKIRPLISLKILAPFIVLALIIMLLASPIQKITAPDADHDRDVLRIALLPLVNESGDTSLRWVEMGVRDLVAAELAANDAIEMADPAELQAALQESARYDELFSVADLKRLRANTTSDLAVQIVVEQSGDRYRMHFIWSAAPDRVGQGVLFAADATSAARNIVDQLIRAIDDKSYVSSQIVTTDDAVTNRDLAFGLEALRSGNLTLAKHYFETVLRRDPNLILASRYLGEVEYRLGQWDESKTQFSQLVDGPNPAFERQALIGLSRIARDQGRFADAEKMLNRALSLALSAEDTNVEVECYWLLGELRVLQGLWQEERSYVDRALKRSEETGDVALIYRSLYYIGRLDSPTNDPSSRFTSLQQAERYFTQWRDVNGLAYTRLAMASKYLRPRQERRDNFENSIELFRTSGDVVGLSKALKQSGWHRLQLFAPTEAEPLLYEALTLHESMGDEVNAAIDEFYLAFAALDRGASRRGAPQQDHLDRADSLLQTSIENFGALAMPDHVFVAHLLRACVAVELGKYDAAIAELAALRSGQGSTENGRFDEWLLVFEAYIQIRQGLWAQAQTTLRPKLAATSEFPLTLYLSARINYELENYAAAVANQERLREILGVRWTDAEQQRLNTYLEAQNNSIALPLEEEPSLYFVIIKFLF